jgi:hypothetical protein
MSKSGIDVARLALDELGRTVLPDDLLDQIMACEHTLSAGANGSCWGTSNAGCSNGACGDSTNWSCTNYDYCGYSSNHHYCVGGPLG